MSDTANVPASAPAGDVPSGFSAWNEDLHYRNSLYWSKYAMERGPGDLSHAVITHWLIGGTMAYSTAYAWNIPHSIKRPLETRIWYRYPDQDPANAIGTGTGTSPTMVARVLDGGSTQLTQATYNALGMVTSRTDPLSRQTTYTYAPNGIDLLEVRQTTSAGSDLLASYTGYNAQRLPTTVTDAAGQTTTMTYTALGQPLTVTNAKAETTTYGYNAATARLLTVTGPVAGATTTYTYDAQGRVRTVTDSDGYMVTTDYDALDRAVKRTYPDGTYEQSTYARLDLVEERDRKGRITRHFYDRAGRRTTTRDPLGRVIRQEWCSCGSLEALVDANGNRTRWERDAAGRVTREVRADGVTATEYTYDATGRLRTVTDPKGQATTHTYAADGQLSGTTYGNAAVPTPGVSYTYDPVYRRVLTMVDGIGTTTYTYKSAGQLGAGQVATVDGPLTNDVIAYTYDQLGRVTSRSINAAANTVTWDFDPLSRVISETNVLGGFTYAYDGATSRLASVTYPNGQTSAYSYLSTAQDHRLHTIHHKYPNGGTLSKFDYTYDPIGNILTWRQQADADPAVLWTYGYDAADQLTSAVQQSTGAVPATLQRFGYGYDAAGNRTFEQIGEQITTATHDRFNRLLTHTPGGPLEFAGTLSEPASVTIQGVPASVDSGNGFRGSPAVSAGASTVSIVATDTSGNQATRQYQLEVTGGAKTFTYDANGNLTSDGTRTFEWDARNRLTRLTDGSLSVTYSYDGYSRRTASVTKSGATTIEDTKTIWCGLTVCEIRGVVGAPVLTARYQFAVVSDGRPSFIARDHLMSVRDVTDSNGSLLARYDFSPWGERMLMQGTDVVSFGFTGQSSSRPDIWNMTYRDYDATIARWLNQDPIGLAGGINLHGYVQGNPIRNIDPSGLVTVMSSGPQRTGVTSSEIDGGCGLYDPNATFSGACKCMAGGFKAELLVTFHPKIFVALDVVTPPEDIYNHELMHHQVAQGTVNAAIREGEAIERRVFGSQGECNSAITKWAQSYEALMMKRTVRERLADFFGLFWCNPMRRDVSA